MKPTVTPEERAKNVIRKLIWAYFWLLIFEGALRKWVLPQLSNPLLVVRDPVLLAIFIMAIPAGVFPKNGWVVALLTIGFISLGITFVELWPYLPPQVIAFVGLFGFRSNFLHLPLIFVMAQVLRPEDVKKFGYWTLLTLIPMSILLVAQFRSAPDAFLNTTPGGEGEMMMTSMGKVRTAGTFSFVIGVVAFYSMATGYLVWALLKKAVFPTWLLLASGVALVIGIAVSGSRSVVGACVVVVASLALVVLLRPRTVNRAGKALVVVVVLCFIVSRMPVFKEGVNVLTARFTEVAEATEQSVTAGLFSRVLGNFEEPFYIWTKAPFLGYGLGIGTNAGAKFLTGRATFLLTESEWSRIFLESGPVLGLAFVLWRCAIVLRVLWLTIKSVMRDNLLPLLLFSSGSLPMINGQFGQPTILGFTVFVMGLALAARNEDLTDSSDAVVGLPARRIPQFARGRSAYAERLHGSGPETNDQTNGAADR